MIKSHCKFHFVNKMARTPKDAIVLCLDVGPGMTQAPPGSDTPLESSIKIISMMLQRKIFSESKDEVALVLFGTEDTLNNLADDDGGYQNITVSRPLGISGFDLLEDISKIHPGPKETDFLDALTVGLDILHEQTKGKNIEYRRLILFTNFDHQFSDDNLEGIIGGFCCENEEVQLNIIAPQFEESVSSDGEEHDSGSDGEGPSVKKPKLEKLSEKPKTPQQRAGERLINSMLEQGVDGCAYSYDQAVLALTGFEKKSVRSVAWKCHLTLGNDLTIPCAAHVKTKAATLKKSWIKCYAKTQKSDDIMKQRYFVLRSDGQTEVDEENISKGYKYGKDIIPFSKVDEEQMKYKTEGKCLSILGFTDSSNIRVQDLMDDQSHHIVSEKDDNAAETALSALVTAMQNQNVCAVARYVYRKGTNPKLMALMPRIKEEYRYLVMIALPYAEDLRTLDFPSLESKKNVAPSQNQLSAIDSLIDTMDLCKGEKELYRPREMLNPYFQRVYQSLNHRAVNPKSSLPPTDDRIKSILDPDQQILERSRLSTAEVKKYFELVKEEVKPKKKSGAETWAAVSLDDEETASHKLASGDASSSGITSIAQITSTATVSSVGSISPDQDFITLLKNAENDADIQQIFEQLQQRVMEFILDTFTAGCNRKVFTCLTAMKEQAISKNVAHLYNTFLKRLKPMLIADKIKMQYWKEMTELQLTLIEGEGVSSDEVAEFLTLNAEGEEGIKSGDNEQDEDVEDLLDEL
ncbi:X-ray repair cross-complementing protein 5-like [Styela clava]